MTETDPQIASIANWPRAASTTQRIKDYILLNRLHPGDSLPTETELCATLSVSRSSVREAVRRLAALDIVEVRHGHGTFVGRLSLSPLVEGLVFRGVLSPGDDLAALREVVDLRIALDTAMAERMAEVFAGTSNPDLDELVDEMVAKSAQGLTFPEADREFHSRLTARLGNQLLEQLVTAFWQVHTAVYPKLGLAPAQQLDETAKAHGAMLRAAEAGDATGIKAAIREHYAPLLRALDRDRAAHNNLDSPLVRLTAQRNT
jgi:DNA-binding FadR family transcriptional regulator